MKKYYANFNVNNGTALMNSVEDTNLNSIRKQIKTLASSEIFLHNRGKIIIWEDDREIEWYEAKWCGGAVKWFKKA